MKEVAGVFSHVPIGLVRVRVRVRVFCLCLALLFTSGNLLSFGSVKISGMINTETMCIRGVSEVRLWFRVQGIGYWGLSALYY